MTAQEIILNDFARKNSENIDRLVSLVERTFIATQLKEAEKQPTTVNVYVVNVVAATLAQPSPKPIQVLGRNPLRREVALLNVGPSTLLFYKREFDPVSTLQQFSDPSNPSPILPAPNQMVRIGYLPATNNVTYIAQEGLWLYNIAAGGSLCVLYETVFTPPDYKPEHPGLDGHLGQGYMTVPSEDGRGTVLKGLV